MQHVHDFDIALPTPLESDDNFCEDAGDGARAPRGTLIAVVIGTGMWAALIAGFLAFR